MARCIYLIIKKSDKFNNFIIIYNNIQNIWRDDYIR